MNIYLIGVMISMAIYIAVGTLAGRKVKNVDDYYVAGRRAPTILIVGSLVASFLSTGAFLGDTGEVYSGFFMPIVIVGVMQGTGIFLVQRYLVVMFAEAGHLHYPNTSENDSKARNCKNWQGLRLLLQLQLICCRPFRALAH